MEVRKRGSVRVADQVIAAIAGMAAKEVPGIAMRSGGLYEDITKKFQGANVSKGISVKLSEERIQMELRVTVPYGVKIHQLCHQLQATVKKQVEYLTGLLVEEVNIHVEALTAK